MTFMETLAVLRALVTRGARTPDGGVELHLTDRASLRIEVIEQVEAL